MTRRDLSDRAERLRTLLIFTVLQGFLLTLNLNLLPISPGEAATARGPLDSLLTRAWLQVTGATDPLWSLRLLSALFTICCTILLDRLWLRKASADTHQWMLLLWAFSPSLLLFGRMAQSYSLQALLTVIVVWSALNFLEETESWPRLAALAASLIALLYTDCLPGIVMWTGVNVLLLQRTDRRSHWKTLLLPNVLVAAACIPWMSKWGPRDLYSLTGNAVLEAALRLGYGFYSLAFGEAIPVWLLALTAIVAGPYLWLLFQTARAHREWIWPAAVTALLAWAGAADLVSFPFMGSRLLFLLPLLILAIAAGIVESGRFGTIFAIALFAANAGGIWYYFEARDMINIAYVAPQRQIAKTIVQHSLPADTLVWVDGWNVNATVLRYYLPANYPVAALRSAADAEAAWDEQLLSAAIHNVWFIRNASSPNPALDRLEQRMMGTWHYHALHPYVPAPEAYRLGLKYILHQKQPPRYLYQVWEFHR